MLQATKSAALPASSVPCVVSNPSARAPWRVAPANASSGVRRNSVQAMLSIRRSDSAGEVPGLRSVEMAIGTPWRRSRSTGGSRVSRSA